VSLMSECNCSHEHETPYWHAASCPVYATACDYCDGKGYVIVRLGCECCTDTERCDECSGTGVDIEKR
jgi:hypothetical protein